MPIFGPNDEIVHDYSIDDLIERANYMRGLNEIALWCAGSGHSGGTLSIMDIAAALYLRIAHHKPSQPGWPDRDRIVWSAGHKAPALYTALAVSGYFPELDLARLRMLGSPYQGHPHWRDCPGVEISSGSLGQGFSVAVGMALAAKLDRKKHRVFAISSDGEQQEGSIWEAAMSASHHGLDNLILIIDKNRLQIDGATKDVMDIEPLDRKYRAFGWHVIELDGHDMLQLVAQLEWARDLNDTGKPVVLIARTNKGHGVSFMKDVVSWHGKSPNTEELREVLQELGLTDKLDPDAFALHARTALSEVEDGLSRNLPKFNRDFWWNSGEKMKVEMDPTRKGFGRALKEHGGDPRVVCIGADISDSITISEFYIQNPERKDRFISLGVAEQNATTVAAGLARDGKIPVFGTYGVFSSARNLDQVRISVCYSNVNVLLVGAHGGISVGPDGATHQELESLFQMTGLPNMHVGVPCDSLETQRMTQALLFDVVGPKYLRFAREATPIVTTEQTPFEFGRANVYRLREEAEHFTDAFEVTLARDYKSESEALTIISCGPELAESLRAAYILKTEFDLETRVLNMHTLKPLDREAIVRSAAETGAVITAEEHQVGGLGNLVAAAILEANLATSLRFAMVGMPDTFGESGQPWQLIKKYGLSAESITMKAKELLQI